MTEIRLTLYSEAGAFAAIVLDRVRAIAVAQRLDRGGAAAAVLAGLQRATFRWPGNRPPLRAGTRYSADSGAQLLRQR
jgi:hypothetical protein